MSGNISSVQSLGAVKHEYGCVCVWSPLYLSKRHDSKNSSLSMTCLEVFTVDEADDVEAEEVDCVVDTYDDDDVEVNAVDDAMEEAEEDDEEDVCRELGDKAAIVYTTLQSIC